MQYNSPDRDRFFSRMFSSYITLLGLILVGYVFLLKVNYGWMVAEQYRESLNYIYPLGLSAVIFAAAAFFDMGYQCAKDTKRTLPAIVLSAVINVVLNFLLIKPLGVYGVIVTQLVTYLVLFIYRWHDMRRYFVLNIGKLTAIPVAVMLVSALPFYHTQGIWLNLFYMILALACIIASCDKDVRELILSKFTKSSATTK